MIDKDKILSKKKVGTSKVEGGTLTFSCGHTYPTDVVTRKKCLGCRESETQEKNKQARENRKKKREKLIQEGGWKGKAGKNLSRLPHHSNFDVTYDGTRTVWSGHLNICEVEEGAPTLIKSFYAEAPAVFKLLAELDNQYRKWLEEQTGTIVNVI